MPNNLAGKKTNLVPLKQNNNNERPTTDFNRFRKWTINLLQIPDYQVYVYKVSQKIVGIVEVKKLCLPLAVAYC